MILLAYQEESNATCQKLEKEVDIYSFFIHSHTIHHKTSFKKIMSE
jgi:hypothetical protein